MHSNSSICSGAQNLPPMVGLGHNQTRILGHSALCARPAAFAHEAVLLTATGFPHLLTLSFNLPAIIFFVNGTLSRGPTICFKFRASTHYPSLVHTLAQHAAAQDLSPKSSLQIERRGLWTVSFCWEGGPVRGCREAGRQIMVRSSVWWRECGWGQSAPTENGGRGGLCSAMTPSF